MATQYIEKHKQYKQYPLFQNTRLRRSNVARIKARATIFGESVDGILTKLFDQLEDYERIGAGNK